ncbi:D-2-hydroxyacid dehydrogenase [Mycobacterium sp. 155]|uniref:D-2-hydroxyacid dehydrogenase n=1 Tax=Mycobacterium sp. 155 TaxID=1157943 RepID=UPI00055C511D|nr:D-2-hydroxyacid dehydrogenase [Mycobacterium sp. 155]
MPSPRPVIAVLCERATDRPAGVADLDVDADFRYCAAGGLAEALQGAQALLMWDYFSTALRGAWSAADTLQWIHVTAAGVDTLLFDELRDSDVVVTNARGVFDRPMAEYVLGAIIGYAKGSQVSFDRQRRHQWHHRETRTIMGAHALVVGTGGIGREIARLLRAAGLAVRGAGRVVRADDPDFGRVVATADLAAEVGWCDHLVLAAPLTDATRGLVGANVLAAMRSDAHLVNVARGPLVDESALVTALTTGSVGGATLDVFDTEPLPENHPLWDAPGAVITAHMSGDTIGWRDTVAAQFADNLRRWLSGQPLHNVVDKKLGYVSGTGAALFR